MQRSLLRGGSRQRRSHKAETSLSILFLIHTTFRIVVTTMLRLKSSSVFAFALMIALSVTTLAEAIIVVIFDFLLSPIVLPTSLFLPGLLLLLLVDLR